MGFYFFHILFMQYVFFVIIGCKLYHMCLLTIGYWVADLAGGGG